MIIHHKHQILESLNSMDGEQTAKVLQYMRGLLEKRASETEYERFRKNAMREIREALKKR
jgi:hypothetical protein